MGKHGRPTKIMRQRGKRPVRAHPATAPRRNRWIILASVLIIFVLIGILFPTQRHPEKPSPPVPPAESTAVEVPPKPETELSAEQKVAALKADEMSLVQQLIEDFPQNEQPYVLLGNVHRRRGAIDEAVSAWQKAVQMNPARSDVYDKLAQAAFETDELEKAISLWRQALAADPAALECHLNIGRALMRLGQYEESLPEIQEELERNPDNVLSHFILARAHQHLQDYERARANYEKVIAFQPDHMNAYYGLYNVCARLRQPDDAKRYLAEFQRLKKQDEERTRQLDEAMTDLGVYSRGLARLSFEAYHLYRAQGNPPRAEELLKRAIGLDPRNTVFIERLIVLYQSRNRLRDALTWSRRMAQIDPENAMPQLNIGVLSAKLRRFEDAEKAFAKAIDLAPGHHGGYQELAQFYLRRKANLPKARKLAQKAVELHASAKNHHLLAVACLADDDLPAARAALQHAIDLDPRNAMYAAMYRSITERMRPK